MAELQPSCEETLNVEEGKPSFFKKVSNKASTYHARVPYLQKLPFSALAIILTLIFINLVVWAAIAIVLVGVPNDTHNYRYTKLHKKTLTQHSTGTPH
jgi:high-affinity nickel-transport protein